MARHRFGAVVVTDATGELRGVLSEHDIVTGLTGMGPEILNASVGEMTGTEALCCAPDDQLEDVLTILAGRRLEYVPIVHDGCVVGVLDLGDVILARIEETSVECQVLLDLARLRH
jgi:CBS domain-containing protein